VLGIFMQGTYRRHDVLLALRLLKPRMGIVPLG
jgi:hypothetical protein